MADGPVPPLERLRAARGYVFDLDGTLVLGDRNNQGLAALPGALEITRWVARQGLPFAVFTNGTTKTPQHLERTLAAIGFELPGDAVLTPASSAVAVFARRGYRRVLVLGGDGLAGPLHDAGIEVVMPDGRPVEVDAVLAGWYPEFTLPALEVACHAVWAGARLYSASQSLFFATAGGRLRVPLTDLVVVGDDPELEVPMAHRGRALAVAVSSGLGGPESYRHLPPERQPHLHLSGVDELLSLCDGA